MKKTELKMSVGDAVETLLELRADLENHIADLHGVKGCVQARHCYCYYRDKVTKAIHDLGGH